MFSNILITIRVYICIIYVGMYVESLPARTAQGGGGSFKDRKPIGEVDCCE